MCVSQGLYPLSYAPAQHSRALCLPSGTATPATLISTRLALPIHSGFGLNAIVIPQKTSKAYLFSSFYHYIILPLHHFPVNAVSPGLAPQGPACCYLSSIWNVAWHTVCAVHVFISGTKYPRETVKEGKSLAHAFRNVSPSWQELRGLGAHLMMDRKQRGR